jgi:cell division protein FtsQ
MKRVLNIIFLIILASGAISLFVFANVKQEELKCSMFEIEIDYDGAPILITKSTIRNMVTKSGIRVKDQLITDIPVTKLQKVINSNPYVKKATLSVSVNGVVKAAIQQRDPVARIMDVDNNQYILDKTGYLMPINQDFPVRLVFANGNISIRKNNKPAVKEKATGTNTPNQRLTGDLSYIHKAAMAIHSDSLTNALVEQIYLNEMKEIELVPKVGNQLIILGDTSQINQKLHNLKVFYQEGIKNFALNNYKTINLKYKNQVVCSK